MVLYARDVVEKDFLSMPASSSVLEAAKAMSAARKGFVVVGSGGRPEGIVTEWDLLSKVVARARDPAGVRLEEVMSKDLVSVDAGLGLSMVSQVMTQKGIRRLLVEKDGEVVGVITSKTLMAHLSEYVDKVSAQISKLQTPGF
jgi:CBS domain-containing protein